MADNFPIFDANRSQKTIATDEVSSGVHATKHVLIPISDSPVSLVKLTGLVDTVTDIKASAGTLLSLVVTNSHSAVQFVQIFNVASGSVTLGTTVADLVVAVPANTTVSLPLGPYGLAFGTAISAAATTTPGGSTAATASTMRVYGSYK